MSALVLSGGLTRAVIVWLLAAGLVATAHGAELEQVTALAGSGASRLALELLERDQPPASDSDQWAAWEKQRFAIYRELEDWDAIARHADALPEEASPVFRRWALGQAVDARLASGDAEGARSFLRRLLWRETPDERQLAQLRRSVIRSYLLDDKLTDAQAALLRFQQDYTARGSSWQVLHAELLLRGGDAKAAFDVLAGVQAYDARLLRLAAALRGGLYRSAEVMKQAHALADELKAHPARQRHAWVLVAEAAERGKRSDNRVMALEKALALPAPSGVERLFPVDADALWEAYEAHAQTVGNRGRLMIGKDAEWLKMAARYKEKDAHQARAVYAFLGARGSDVDVRNYGHLRLVESLFEHGLGTTAQALYVQSVRYARIGDVPAPVRYRLADKALAESDIKLTAELVRDLDKAPLGEEEAAWTLRRARVLVYAGDYPTAAQLLGQIVESDGRLSEEFADRYLQVVFDLQAVERHEEAVALLERLLERVDSDRLKREILFWIADSKSARGEHRAAAELYLRSATYNGASGADPWGETARFHAAGALGKAGLTEDARGVYLRLLKTTTDPKRRAVIQRQLQQLWLTVRTATMP